MSKESKIFEDISKLFESSVSNAINMKDEAKNSLIRVIETAIAKMNFAKKDDLDAVKKLAQKNHKELLEIKKHLNIQPAAKSTKTIAKAKSGK